MSAFKDQIARDIHAVFLNPKEFAEIQELAGKEVPIVSEMLEMAQSDSSDGERMGVSYEGVTLYVALSDVPDKFMPNKKTTYRGEDWWVLDANREELRTIRLYRERS